MAIRKATKKDVDRFDRFRTFGELLDHVEKNIHKDSHSKNRTDDFCGVSWREAIRLGREGWQEGVHDLALRVEQVEKHLDINSGTYHWDVSGQLFDVGTMLTGQPEHWLEPDLAEIQAPVKILVNMGINCAQSRDAIRNRGAAIVAAVDTLQKAGHHVDLELVCPSFFNGCNDLPGGSSKKVREVGGMSITIQTDPLDLDMMAFAFGHESFVRRLFFGWQEIHFGAIRVYRYGFPTDLEDSASRDGTPTIYFPSTNHRSHKETDYETIEEAARTVERIINTTLNR